MTPEQTKRVTDMRERILENEKNGLPPYHDIDRKELGELFELLRDSRGMKTKQAKETAKSKEPLLSLDDLKAKAQAMSAAEGEKDEPAK